MSSEADIWQPRTILALSSDTKRITQKLTASVAQTLFTITDFSYVVGTGALQVFKNGVYMVPNVDFVEGTTTTFSLTIGATVGDIVVAVGYAGITGTVDVRDTDIFLSNYQALRDYAGTETTIYIQGTVLAGDGGQAFFQKFTGAASGTYVDDGLGIIVPTGGDGSIGCTKSIRQFYPTISGEVGVTDNTYPVGNVKRYGAVGGTAASQITAFDNAYISVKSIIAAKVNARKIVIPYEEDGYRLDSTWLLDNHRGITIEFESSQLYSSEADAGSNAQLQWYGNATTPVILLEILVYGTHIINPSINAKASTNKALAGIQVGDVTGTTAARNIKIINPFIFKARFGIAVGYADNGNIDAAPLYIEGGILANNDDGGLWVASGNSIVKTSDIYYSNNGQSPTTDTHNPTGKGGNTYVSSGQLSEYTRVSAGTTSDADVYQLNGTYSVDTAWSDVLNVFLFNAAHTEGSQAPSMRKVRHYSGLMTDVNTPTSIIVKSKGFVAENCSFFGDAECNSGASGEFTFIGQQFYNGTNIATVRPTLGQGTYKGTGKTTQKAIIEIGSNGNNARISAGGGGTNSFAVNDYLRPFLALNGLPLAELHSAATGNSGAVIGTNLNPTNGSFEILINCYAFSATEYKAFKIGLGTRITVGLGGVVFTTYDFADTTTAIAGSAFTAAGGFRETANGFSVVSLPKIAGDPTDAASAYEGFIYYDDTANVVKFSNGTVWGAV